MKKFLIFTLIFLPAMAMAQELTAETMAVDSTLLDQVKEVILGLLAALMGWLIIKAKAFIQNDLSPLVSSWLKANLHFKGSSVVADAIAESIVEIAGDILEKVSDNKLTKEELEQIKKNAIAKAIPRLQNLAGFYKKDLTAWVEEQVSIQVGKFLILNSSSSGSKTP